MKNSLKNLIQEEYGIKILDVVKGPRQFVAETFILTTERDLKYFIKLIKRPQDTEIIIQGLSVLIELYKLGFKRLNYPIKTRNEKLHVLKNDYLVILFNFIDGIQTFDFDLETFAGLIAKVHQKTEQISTPVKKETFEPLYLYDIPEYIEKATGDINKFGVARELKEYLIPYKEEIQNDWKSFLKICDKCKTSFFDFKLTHGDPAGNVIKDKNSDLFIVDWDDIKLAPAERDTWFHSDKKEFINGYQKIFPNYKINKLTYGFYVYNRFWEDILGFIKNIYASNKIEFQRKNLFGLKKDCTGWLRPLIRSLDLH